MDSLIASEVGAVFALVEFLATVTVTVVSAQALHVARAELAEFTGEHCVHRCRGWAGRGSLYRFLVAADLLLHIHSVCKRRICEVNKLRLTLLFLSNEGNRSSILSG